MSGIIFTTRAVVGGVLGLVSSGLLGYAGGTSAKNLSDKLIGKKLAAKDALDYHADAKAMQLKLENLKLENSRLKEVALVKEAKADLSATNAALIEAKSDLIELKAASAVVEKEAEKVIADAEVKAEKVIADAKAKVIADAAAAEEKAIASADAKVIADANGPVKAKAGKKSKNIKKVKK